MGNRASVSSATACSMSPVALERAYASSAVLPIPASPSISSAPAPRARSASIAASSASRSITLRRYDTERGGVRNASGRPRGPRAWSLSVA